MRLLSSCSFCARRSCHLVSLDCLAGCLPYLPARYFVVCCNVLGSCYGTTGPTSTDPASPTGSAYEENFPAVTIRDTVRLHMAAVQQQGVTSVAAVVGGSMGGMQALEWLLLGNDEGLAVRSGVVLASCARHAAWQIAISETQRSAISLGLESARHSSSLASSSSGGGGGDDDDVGQGSHRLSDEERAGMRAGLAVARQIAMVSYRSPAAYERKFGRDVSSDAADGARGERPNDFSVVSYLGYQGEKFLNRFDPLSYVSITHQMDSHDIGRGRAGGVEGALGSLEQPVLVMGIDSDVLYPLTQQEELHRFLPNSRFQVIESDEGHDGFLLEVDQLGSAVSRFLKGVAVGDGSSSSSSSSSSGSGGRDDEGGKRNRDQSTVAAAISKTFSRMAGTIFSFEEK